VYGRVGQHGVVPCAYRWLLDTHSSTTALVAADPTRPDPSRPKFACRGGLGVGLGLGCGETDGDGCELGAVAAGVRLLDAAGDAAAEAALGCALSKAATPAAARTMTAVSAAGGAGALAAAAAAAAARLQVSGLPLLSSARFEPVHAPCQRG
jgi:hypothetical protein